VSGLTRRPAPLLDLGSFVLVHGELGLRNVLRNDDMKVIAAGSGVFTQPGRFSPLSPKGLQ